MLYMDFLGTLPMEASSLYMDFLGTSPMKASPLYMNFLETSSMGAFLLYMNFLATSPMEASPLNMDFLRMSLMKASLICPILLGASLTYLAIKETSSIHYYYYPYDLSGRSHGFHQISLLLSPTL